MSVNEEDAICSPIKTLNELLNISSSSLTNRLRTYPLVQRSTSPKQKILVCHDMKGGYLEDRHRQGCQTDQECYRFFRWHLIDIFIYFSHELVTIPPLVWIDCAHRNGVQILGTFITEFDSGKEICRQLLASDEIVDQTVDALALLMAWYSFDGYLLNIENPIEFEYVPRLLSFVSKLKSACSKIDKTSIVIWYDSVTINGDLRWQNQLNNLNQPFFEVCDGIFLNYTWKSEMLLQSKINAGGRYRDVFVGIDVFGRGCFGDGGFNTCEAISLSFSHGLSAAIFAPGWLFETLESKQFVENDRKFWNLLEPFTCQRILELKSLSTCFSDGFGKTFYLHGLDMKTNGWYNLSLQTYFPNVLNENQWLVNHSDAYFGGSCLEIDRDFQLFKCLISIESNCEIVLVFKGAQDVFVDLKLDNGTTISLEQTETKICIRDWTRKIYQIKVNEQISITDISIRHIKKSNVNLKLGYFSVKQSDDDQHHRGVFSLIQSIDSKSNSTTILNFIQSIYDENPSSIRLIFARNQFEENLFLGATRQSSFSIFHSDKSDRSILSIRYYSFDSLDLLSTQIVSIPAVFNSLKGFLS